MSIIGSVVKRHGGLIEAAIAGALEASERFIVLSNVAVPLTKGAIQALDGGNSDKDLANIRLRADSEAAGIVNIDQVVVDPETRWAGAYEIKRGNGTTEHGKRRPIIRKLRAARLVLPSFVDKLGYGPIDTATSAVIDYFGASGFDPNFALTAEQLDAHFGVPVVGMVEAVTAATREALQAELPRLFKPVVHTLDVGKRRRTSRGKRDRADVSPMLVTDVPRILTALDGPPIGPGECHAAARMKH